MERDNEKEKGGWKMRLIPTNTKRNDCVQTPIELAKQLVEHFKPQGKILEPCKGDGNFLKVLPKGTAWCEILEGKDFFDYNGKVDWIITNPPYSLKDEFLENCYKWKTPFALLMPLTALEGKKRQALYRRHGIQLIIPNKRINSETPSGKGSGSWFMTAWFTWGLNLPKELNFVEIQ